MNTNRDLGNLGESSFQTLCHQVGLVPTGSSIDKNGWDFIVEFPVTESQDSAELHKIAKECRIQVKATDGQNREWQLKLSNLHRLCTNPDPAFVFFMEYDGKGHPERVFLVHLDNAWITKVLHRIHTLKQEDPNVKLNKKMMTVHYSDDHLLAGTTGEALMEVLNAHIGDDFHKYTTAKSNHLASTGYEEECGVCSFTATGEENIQAIIDSHLGKTTKVPIKNFKGYLSRFGIKESSPMVDSMDGVLEISPGKPEVTGTISFRMGKYGKKVSLPCKFYTGAMKSIFPKEMQRFRVSCTLIDLVFTPASGSCNTQFLFSDDTILSLSELRNTLEVCSFFAQGKEKIHCELSVPNKSALDFSFNGNSQFNPPEALLEVVEHARVILKELDVNEDVVVSIPQLLNMQEPIKAVAVMLGYPPEHLRVDSYTETPNYLSDGEYCGFIRSIGLLLGNKYLGFQYVLYGTVKQLGESHYQLHPSGKEIEFLMVLDDDESFDKNYIEETIQAIEQKHPDVKFLALRD